ncbi:MAG: UvrD-helicase domain-containing protein [Erysipelotrichaceae bacterium]|nr:UvrD-helicase domain-containing protein [Erysipelotrichaceae bacterium]
MSEILASLNAAQKAAVTTTEGPVRVIAGAGSGKTRALTHRYAYLVNELFIRPDHILCVTFTNKAAQEMKQRIHKLIGDSDTAYINTFHGFCAAVLSEEIYTLAYPENFLILDNSDINDMLERIYEEHHLTLRQKTFAEARDMFEIQKLFKRPQYYEELIDTSAEELRRRSFAAQDVDEILFWGYLYEQKKCFALDYNDLIKFTLHIFAIRPDIKEKWQKKLEYIMIDEFQDIDFLQYELMEVLQGYHHNLFVVGDPDQTIYTWRGADIRYLLLFDKRFKDTQTIFLEENYRSSPQILAVADSLIRKNQDRIEKILRPTRENGSEVLCLNARSEEEEAALIAAESAALIEKGTAPRDIAVLYRAHYVSRSIETALLKKEIPYVLYSGIPFYERSEVKDALSYLRFLAYRDDLSFLRIVNRPKRQIGKRRISHLLECQEKEGGSLYELLQKHINDEIFRGTQAEAFLDLFASFGNTEKEEVFDLLEILLERSGYRKMLRTMGSQEKLDNLASLQQSVREFEISSGEENHLQDYLRHVSFFTNADQAEKEAVKLMTVHAAKGLEFPVVFLCGLNEGIFPSAKTATRPQMEEERRLAFVAMTRARDRLILSASNSRADGGVRYPSRFLLDPDPSLIRWFPPLSEEVISETRYFVEANEQKFLLLENGLPFREGDRIRHAIFGSGTLEKIDLKEGIITVRFDRLETSRELSLKAAKGLQKIEEA